MNHGSYSFNEVGDGTRHKLQIQTFIIPTKSLFGLQAFQNVWPSFTHRNSVGKFFPLVTLIVQLV
jgi:hypothetical protein